eukprot:comp17306_c0_seq1/m.16475 comp17306_c0_seq1/g.16475  ORF comp17306_c0_seq1/g.16475 comp17306_c0_seq1/m.16475 type:complete len:302 (-) comp17306_c0_seq1:137-1042(-)
MASYTVPRTKQATKFDPSIKPVLSVEAPCTITFETDDTSYERLSKGETAYDIGWENINVVTGPVYINGAEAGDTLKIEILDVAIERTWCVWEPDPKACGVLAEKAQGETHIFEVPIIDGEACLSSRLRVPLQPMIGCMAVAPPPAEAPSSTFEPAYPWGGNMDLKELEKGTTVWLPVQVPGALLSVGDLHALMGAGEPAWVGLESSGQAVLQVSVVKDMPLKYPRLRKNDETLFMGMANDHLNALQVALNDAYDFLVQEKGLTRVEAFAYTSAKLDVRFGGPAGPMVLIAVPDPEEFLLND